MNDGEVPDLLDIARGFMKSRVLLTAVELDLFVRIGQDAKTVEQLCAEMGTHPRSTERLLNALVGMGLLVKSEDGTFRNVNERCEFPIAGAPDYGARALRLYADTWPAWSTLTEVMKTGRPGPEQEKVWSPARAEAFMTAMERFARRGVPLLLDAIELGDAGKLLDVGGGPATFSIGFCRRYPKLEAVVLDLPQVVPIARRKISEAGLDDRITTRAGDYRTTDFGSGYDVVLLFSILHINSPDENRALLDKAFRALNSGGQVLIQEFFTDDTKTQPPYSALFGINMLVNTERGDVYSENEVRGWLESAGFRDIRRLEDNEQIGTLAARRP